MSKELIKKREKNKKYFVKYTISYSLKCESLKKKTDILRINSLYTILK